MKDTYASRHHGSVVLANIRDAHGSHHSRAYIGHTGALVIETDGRTADDQGYESVTTVRDVEQLHQLLGGRPGENVIDVLERDFTGSKAARFLQLLEEHDLAERKQIWG